jgi:hypothetical protein
MTLTIRQHREYLSTTDIYGNAAYMDVIDLGTKGKIVAEVEGDIEPTKDGDIDMIRMAGEVWCVWQVLSFARRGERGLRVVA